jgi:DNA-binding CsgD family transcriptional regulator
MAGRTPNSRSNLLRVQDVCDAYRLIGECRDLGRDPILWHRHLFGGLLRLFGVAQVAGGEGWWVRPQRAVHSVSAYDASFDSCAHDGYVAYLRANGPAADPIFHALQRTPERLVTHTRRQLVSDAAWYRSVVFDSYRRPARVDHQLTSVFQVTDEGATTVIGLLRTIGERDFSPREQELLRFLHGELGPLVGRSLVSALEPSPEKLPPRLRQTFACLLEGDGEKQVAARLGLSQATVHQYVKALYHRFGVRSRAQLLAHALRRSGLEPWRRLTPASPLHAGPAPAAPRPGRRFR